MPENSLPAFAAAAEAGYGIELDVRLTRDRVAVVHHDSLLLRTTGVRGRLADLRCEQVARLRLAGTDERVPTLAAALGAVAGRVPVMVEVKSRRPTAGAVEPVVAGVLDGYNGPVCVASFNPRALGWFRRHRPAVSRVLAAGSLHDVPLPSALRRRVGRLRDLALVQPAAVSYELAGLPSPGTDRWRAAGGVLLAWTVRGPAELRRARRLADNVIFEHVRP